MITIWHRMTKQGLYCYLDMGNNTVMYYKCSHVPNLLNVTRMSSRRNRGALDVGGGQYRMSIIRNDNVPCHYLCNYPINFKIA